MTAKLKRIILQQLHTVARLVLAYILKKRHEKKRD